MNKLKLTCLFVAYVFFCITIWAPLAQAGEEIVIDLTVQNLVSMSQWQAGGGSDSTESTILGTYTQHASSQLIQPPRVSLPGQTNGLWREIAIYRYDRLIKDEQFILDELEKFGIIPQFDYEARKMPYNENHVVVLATLPGDIKTREIDATKADGPINAFNRPVMRLLVSLMKLRTNTCKIAIKDNRFRYGEGVSNSGGTKIGGGSIPDPLTWGSSFGHTAGKSKSREWGGPVIEVIAYDGIPNYAMAQVKATQGKKPGQKNGKAKVLFYQGSSMIGKNADELVRHNAKLLKENWGSISVDFESVGYDPDYLEEVAILAMQQIGMYMLDPALGITPEELVEKFNYFSSPPNEKQAAYLKKYSADSIVLITFSPLG